ncbi:MAG: hypothetical protein KBA53_09695 [Thermoclostridium sp.]|nr:hypothetical protein [Thermoclostridium sp.]
MGNYDGYGALAALAVVGVIGAIVGIAFYIFFAFSLFKLAQKRGLDMPWLAWIPIAQFYLIGKMVKTVKISTFEVPSLEIVLPVAMLANVILGSIPVIGFIINLAAIALMLLSLFNLYKQYVPEQAVLYTVLSILGIPVPFFFLKFSKMDPITMP